MQSTLNPEEKGATITTQPGPTQEMKYVGMSEEELKKQRRAENLAKARHYLGETCVICGKVCLVSWTVAAAVCSAVMCLASCLPGDSPGFVGGGGVGFDISAPSDW